MDVTLLGPQRRPAAARSAVAELIPSGSVATVNAGWLERETETEELSDVLGGRMINLRLHARWQQLMAEDPDYAEAERRLTELLGELQVIYALRLQYEMAAVEAVGRRTKVPAAQLAAVDDGIRSLRELDRWHLEQVAETRAAFYARTTIGERESVLRHRAELAEVVAESSGLVITGGHVGVLLHVLHIFGIAALLRTPLIVWSAGAMALSERVVLFHDHGPSGRRHPEMFAEGLGAFGDVVPFPHPRRRLRLDDADQMSVLARRMAPSRCLLLTDGIRVDLGAEQGLPSGARWIGPDGQLVTEPEATAAELVDG